MSPACEEARAKSLLRIQTLPCSPTLAVILVLAGQRAKREKVVRVEQMKAFVEHYEAIFVHVNGSVGR